MEVVVGIDPHKASQHAFAVDERKVELAQLSVRATRTRTQQLVGAGGHDEQARPERRPLSRADRPSS